MRVLLLAISLFLILPAKGFSQINKENLIGTWFPVMEQDYDGDTASVLRYTQLYRFIDADRGILEEIGTNVNPIPFTYNIVSDSIFIEFDEGKLKNSTPWDKRGILLEVDENGFKVIFNSTNSTKFTTTISFIPLPRYEIEESVEELKNELFNEVWEFKMDFEGYGEPYKILYQFECKTDSSRVRKDYQSSIHLVETFQKLLHQTDPVFWAVGKHDKSLIIRVNDVFSSFRSYIYIVKEVSQNQMKLMVWNRGIAYPVIAKRKKSPPVNKLRKALSKISSTKWQFHSEKIPPPIDTTGLIILETVVDDFEEFEPFERDSTAVIRQNDLDEKLLILEFQSDGTYYIYREERVLDTGSWTPIFNMTQLKLKSARKRSSGNGIYGGTIQIDLLKKNKFRLKRKFEQRSPISGTKDESFLETYKPYQKQK